MEKIFELKLDKDELAALQKSAATYKEASEDPRLLKVRNGKVQNTLSCRPMALRSRSRQETGHPDNPIIP